MRKALYIGLMILLAGLAPASLTGCALIYEKAGTNDENSSCVLLCFSSGSDMIGDQEMEPDVVYENEEDYP